MKLQITIIILLISSAVFGQETDDFNVLNKTSTVEKDTLFKPNYPEGIYLSKKDFINKKPSSSKTVVMKGFNKKTMDSIIHNPYFYYLDTDKRVKKVFAISYKGHLYFQITSILKNRNKADKAQSTYFPNTFVRVIIGGENYLYTEAELFNQWAQGAAVNFGAVGGVIANNLIKGKGIVWDFANEEFNIFRSCKDYNDFIQDKMPEDSQACENHQPDMLKVRETIEKIK